MEVLLYFGLPTKNEHDDFSRPQKFIAYPQPHEILKCHKKRHYEKIRYKYVVNLFFMHDTTFHKIYLFLCITFCKLSL